MSELDSLPTPALLLDVDVLERNLARMAGRAAALGVDLRPHAKTHKCPEIAQRQVAHGAIGLTVSTLAEARAFVEAGFDDVLLAFPLDRSRVEAVLELARRVTFRVLVDDLGTARELAAAAARAGVALHGWMKVDCGYHRAGVDPESEEALELARHLHEAPGIAFDGILTHPGHGYHQTSRADILRVANEERDVMVAFRKRCEAKGIVVDRASVGSTPTMSVVEDLTGIDEARPGNYVFHDLMQVELGSCGVADVAVSVLASVVSRRPGGRHAVIDCGALALSKDTGIPGGLRERYGMGAVIGRNGVIDERLRLGALSQEHGILEAAGPRSGAATGAAPLPDEVVVGERLRIAPHHSCLTAAMFDEYVVVQGDTVVDRWRIDRRRH